MSKKTQESVNGIQNVCQQEAGPSTRREPEFGREVTRAGLAPSPRENSLLDRKQVCWEMSIQTQGAMRLSCRNMESRYNLGLKNKNELGPDQLQE